MAHTRRDILQKTGGTLTLVVVGWVAGCSEATSGSGLRVVEGEGRWTTFGDIEYTVTVENTASESKAGTLYVEVSFDNGASYTGSKYVRIPGGESKTVDVKIEVSVFDGIQSREITADAWIDEE